MGNAGLLRGCAREHRAPDLTGHTVPFTVLSSELPSTIQSATLPAPLPSRQLEDWASAVALHTGEFSGTVSEAFQTKPACGRWRPWATAFLWGLAPFPVRTAPSLVIPSEGLCKSPSRRKTILMSLIHSTNTLKCFLSPLTFVCNFPWSSL